MLLNHRLLGAPSLSTKVGGITASLLSKNAQLTAKACRERLRSMHIEQQTKDLHLIDGTSIA
jgi:hypothetical protein